MDIFKYRIWCETEMTWVVGWFEDGQTIACPNDNTHTINEDKSTIIDKVVKQTPIDIADKPWVHQSSRPFGTVTYFTGAGDDLSHHEQLGLGYGTGNLFEYVHNSDSTSLVDYIYFDFDCVENKTYLHEGYITWSGGKRDLASMEIVPLVTEISPSENTYFNLYNNYLIVPNPYGTGTINVPSIDLVDGTAAIDCGLVYMPLDELGNRGNAFWDATWNPDKHIFENINPNPYGTGEYNLFAAEIIMARFINKIPLIESGFLCLQTSDVEEIGHGMRIRGVLETKGVNHDWEFAGWLTLNREKTV